MRAHTAGTTGDRGKTIAKGWGARHNKDNGGAADGGGTTVTLTDRTPAEGRPTNSHAQRLGARPLVVVRRRPVVRQVLRRRQFARAHQVLRRRRQFAGQQPTLIADVSSSSAVEQLESRTRRMNNDSFSQSASCLYAARFRNRCHVQNKSKGRVGPAGYRSFVRAPTASVRADIRLTASVRAGCRRAAVRMDG